MTKKKTMRLLAAMEESEKRFKGYPAYIDRYGFAAKTRATYLARGREFEKFVLEENKALTDPRTARDFLLSKGKRQRGKVISQLRVYGDFLRDKGVVKENPFGERTYANAFAPLPDRKKEPESMTPMVVPARREIKFFESTSIPSAKTFKAQQERREFVDALAMIERQAKMISERNKALQAVIDAGEMALRFNRLLTVGEFNDLLRDCKSAIAYQGPIVSEVYRRVLGELEEKGQGA